MPTRIARRYVVREEIGRGGMGVVYRARDEKFDAEVAVKVLTAKASADAAERLKREAKLGNLLGKQDGLVRALDWGRLQNGSYYLVIDYVDGARDLDLRLGSLVERVERVYAAATLVRKAHEAGVLHRDVKPANFLLDRKGKLYLTDFGIAKRIDEVEARQQPPAMTLEETQPATLSPELTAANVGLGTPYYMPPEQFENAAGVDVRADVYALGVMLFQALTGSVPYPGRHPAEVYGRVMKARYGTEERPSTRKHLRTIPAALDRVVTQALAPVAEDRFPSVAALMEALDAANWRAGLAGVSPLNPEEDGEAPTVAFSASGGKARPSTTGSPGLTVDQDASSTIEELARPTVPSDRCPGCGHEPLHGDLCPACGADVIALRTQSRLEFKRAKAQSAEAERERAERARISGASLDYGGLQIPKIAWFVIGLMVITGVALNVDWGTRRLPPEPSSAQQPPRDPAEDPDEEVTLVDSPTLTDPYELGGKEREAYDLFLAAHQSWIKWNAYDNVEGDPRDAVLLEVPELAKAFDRYSLGVSDDEPETQARTRRYSFRCVGSADPEVRARVPAD
ncbi:MAG: serine/threonine protein kinase [Planctomycetes bacterium]|nr:serine/threonine protein kinase [Planctomycetota bacterium]